MKKLNLIKGLWDDSHEKRTPQRLRRYAVMLLMLLTLGVGQMWAAPWVKLDVSTGSQGTKTVGDKLNGGSDWWFNYQTNGGWSTGTDIQVLIGTSTSAYSTVDASWYADDGDNKKVHANIGNFEFTKSGKWYAVGKYKSGSTTAYTSGTSWTSNTSLSTSMSTSNSPYWTVNPPAVSDFSVARSGYLAGSGTSEDPYLVASGSTLTLTGSGSKAISDANSSVNYKFGSDAYSTTATKNITVTSSGSIAVKARCINSSASLNGTETSAITIYYAPVSVKDISVYIYVGGCTSDQINSLVLTGTPYVGSVALSGVTKYIGDFTTDGNWRKYTFTNVSEVQSLVVARSGGRAVDNITATADVYAKWDGTALDGKCVSAPSLTWTTAPANGTAGEDMTAVVNTTAVSGGSPSITWESSDDEVARVDEYGVITYVAAGSATITASVSWSATGDYCAGSQDLEQAITVSAAIVPTISAASFTNNPILTWEWVKISFTYANIPDGAYYRIKGGAGYYRDKNNLTNIPISGDGTEDFEAACDQVNMIDNQSWVVEIYNSSNAKITERTVGNLRVTSQAAELSSITLSPNTTQNYAGSPIDITMSVTSKYVPNPVVIFYVADNSKSTTYEVVATTGAIGSRTNYTTTHTATFSASHAATYSVTAKVFAGKLVDDFESTITTWGDIEGGTFSTVTNPYQQAGNGSSHVKQITPNGADWYTAITRTTTAWNNDYQYIHAKMYYQGGTGLKWKISDSPATELSQAIGSTNTWQDVAFNNSGRVTIDFMFPFIAGQTNVFYVDDIILSTEASMTARATQSTAASVTVRDVYTITYKDQGNVAFSGSHVDSPSAHPTTHTYGAATTLNSATKTGYTFNGWFTTSACTGDAVASLGATAYSDDITLYAKWTENMTTVNLVASPAGGGTFTVGGAAATSTTAGVTTTRSVAAVPYPGYRTSATLWSKNNNYITLSSTSTNPTTVTGDGSNGNTTTLTGNFTQTYAYLQGRMTIYNAARSSKTHIGSSEGGWSTSSTNIKMDYDGTNHRFYLHTYMKPSELSAAQSGNNQYFFFKTSTSPSALSNDQTYRPAEGRTLTAAGTGNKKATETSSGTNSIWFNSSTTNGYAILYFDEAGVWYELEHKLLYDGNGNTGGSTPASSGSYYNSGTNATAASNSYTMNNYSFAGWNTSQHISGTNYAAGASVPMTTNRTLYATWTRSVTLNQEDATTEGSTSVTGTWNCSTLPAITNPEKTGYVFGGWYTETAGKGNLVINTAGELQSSVYHWTDQTTPSNRFMRPTDKDYAPLYAKWTQTVTLNANTSYHGSGSNTTATIVYKATAKTSITHCAPATGYHLEGYYSAATGGTKILEANGDFAGSNISVSEDDYISGGAWVHAGNTTLYAHYEPNTYDVTLKANTGTGDDQVVEATYDAAMPTTLKAGGAVTVHTKTGYNLLGYWDNASTGNQYYSYNVGTSTLSSYRTWNKTNNTNLYAHWSAKSYTVTLDVDEANKGTIAGADESASVTFDAAPTTIANRPTAANGYALVGYYTEQLGEGTKLINGDGTWISDVAGYMSSGNWVYDGEPTLYAYYKKAAVTGIAFSPAAAVAPNTEITATPTISPTPTGSTIVCWELQYNNGTPLPSQPTFTAGEGNTVSFDAPEASATYRLQATLRTGSSCAGGTELSVYSTTFQVAGEHTVTVRYQDSDGRTIKASTEITGKPLEWTTAGDITPPTITGYKFDHWDAGDGVTIKNGDSDPVTTTTTSSIQIKAVYDGTLTAVYAKKKLIFFNNTLGWSDVYVYFYNTNKYWNDAFGAGAKKEQGFGDGESEHPYWEQEHGHMTKIEGTNIWYFDYEGAGYSTRANVAFTEGNQHGYQWFNYTKAVVRGDHGSSLQMFVPLTTKTTSKNNTDYYNSGYWMNYPENTGYTLLIYNQKAKAGATKLYEIPFEFTEDYTMPMELKVDLEAGQTYGFEIYRADGTYFSTTTTITANTSNWGLYKNQTSYCGLQTTAAGDYTFSLFYDGEYRVGVTYPVAVNDYRIVYTDLATWSKAAHTASWYHPSGVITKNGSATETKKDTVSFFWTYGSSPAIAYQTCSAVAAGSASWSASTSISVSSYSSVLTEKGIYNFIFEQPAGGASISLIGVEPYTGKYYIRTDCAGSTKWSNFQSTDHEMTYSDYTEKNHGYSHYYTHWVTTGQNVKFCIANDYSQCITDTLVEDIGTVIADITTEGNANAGRLNSGNASIRFMWNQATNKISRAYISGSTNISDRFLVLEGDAKMFDAEGNALSISGLNANEINLVDDQNFVYERTIKVQTGAKAKLTAKYNDNVQYFKGGPGTTSADSVVLLGGSASVTKHTMRIVYDFKTNRLVTAYVPEGDITEALAINADIMLIREHQEAGQQLVFKGDGALSKVKTVYGVMRFNRWTLNNKETTGEHSPVGDPKSAYERGLYWISFPFDVNLSDVFGFGTYGTHWIIMEYDGAERAQKGYWRDSEGFWKYVTNRTDKVLEAGKGYVLALDLDLMRYDDDSFWSNNIEQVELFFPSVEEVENIESTNVTTTVDAHACTIDRTNNNGPDINKNRTRADSHWNIIGIPSYANYGETLKAGAEGEVITWNSSPYTNDLPFLYEWSTVDNTYSVQSGTTYPFKAMHAYMVQYHGDLYWSLASATPVSPIVARRTYAEKPQNVEMRIELQQNEKAVDQTFVKLSNDENVSTNFAFDEDLCKEYNANKANIYTIVENYLPVAGNTMPMSDQTTVVPVGVKIATDGEYTFAIPDGTEGIGVVLIDKIAGTRTNLGLMDYSVTLEQGQIDNRFLLEISPIVQSPTDLENTEYRTQNTEVRKVMIDGILYIVKDGIVYDAQGHRVQ